MYPVSKKTALTKLDGLSLISSMSAILQLDVRRYGLNNYAVNNENFKITFQSIKS